MFGCQPPPPPRTIEEACALIFELWQEVVQLREENGALQEENGALQARVAELVARLGQNSSNSSRPPSSDPSGMRPHGRKPPTGRKRGGQPGHEGHQRTLLPPERVRATHPVKPSRCRRCDAALDGSDPEPLRHQVIDLPRVVATADEYLLHALACPHCNTVTRAEIPPGVPSGNFGPRLQAMVGLWAGTYRLSHRQIEQLLADIYDVNIALGSVTNVEQQVSDALAAPVDEAAQHVQVQPAVHADETGWREAKQKAWLWVAATATVAVFLIRRSRGAQVAKELLGAFFAGILHSDRWSAYNWLDVTRRQLCWAHLVRQFKGFEDYGGQAKALGLALQERCAVMFGWWHRIRDGTLSRSTFRSYMRKVERRILELLRQGAACGVPKVAGRCREILKLQQALFTFVRIEGVEPTNNHAERVLRHAVLWRKGSFGTDSENGSRFVVRILTAVTTLRLQKRNVLDWLTAACEARLARKPTPSLLPGRHHSFTLPTAA